MVRAIVSIALISAASLSAIQPAHAHRGSGRRDINQEYRQYSDNPTWEGAGTPQRSQGSSSR